jgi:hypothetical protein
MRQLEDSEIGSSDALVAEEQDPLPQPLAAFGAVAASESTVARAR